MNFLKLPANDFWSNVFATLKVSRCKISLWDQCFSEPVSVMVFDRGDQGQYLQPIDGKNGLPY